MLECSIAAARSYAVGDPMPIEFRLDNRGAVAYHVLVWYTPLEGILGEIFSITTGEQEVPYRGVLMKRGDPMLEEYVLVPTGASLSAQVDLASSYDLSRPGVYELTYLPVLRDVAEDPRDLPRVRDEHRALELDEIHCSFDVVPRI